MSARDAKRWEEELKRASGLADFEERESALRLIGTTLRASILDPQSAPVMDSMDTNIEGATDADADGDADADADDVTCDSCGDNCTKESYLMDGETDLCLPCFQRDGDKYKTSVRCVNGEAAPGDGSDVEDQISGEDTSPSAKTPKRAASAAPEEGASKQQKVASPPAAPAAEPAAKAAPTQPTHPEWTWLVLKTRSKKEPISDPFYTQNEFYTQLYPGFADTTQVLGAYASAAAAQEVADVVAGGEMKMWKSQVVLVQVV
jgi:hypothetical protein